jgi:hypothetical protein
MARRRKGVDVADLDDVDLLERVLKRVDLDEYERGAFEHMLEELQLRVEQYADDAYPLTDRQREWAEQAAQREKRKLTGPEFEEAVRDTIGRDLKL